MPDTGDAAAIRHGEPDPPTLRIDVDDRAYTVAAGDGPVTIGRELPAQIRVNDPRISRTHLRIEPDGEHWTVADVDSTNGTFLDGRRVASATVEGTLTVHLGNPAGVAVTVRAAAAPAGEDTGTGVEALAESDDGEGTDEEATFTAEQTDPHIARAGAAVAARREELGMSQRTLSEDRVISQSVLVKFERGRHWPRERTRAKIEEYLRWPTGSLNRIRSGAPVPDEDESTEILHTTVRVAVMIDAAEIALRGIHARAATLPAPTDPGFAGAAGELLAELRRLENTVTNAARTASGAPQVALLLSDVRRAYADLTLRAARTPGATLGQRLYAARHRAELSADETANAAGVTVEDIRNAEAELPVAAALAATLEDVIATLGRRSGRR